MKLKLLSKSKMEMILQSSKKPNILPNFPKPVQKEPKLFKLSLKITWNMFGFFWTSFANVGGILVFFEHKRIIFSLSWKSWS